MVGVDPGINISFLCFIRTLAGTESTFIISPYLSSSTNNNNLTLRPGIDFTTLYWLTQDREEKREGIFVRWQFQFKYFHCSGCVCWVSWKINSLVFTQSAHFLSAGQSLPLHSTCYWCSDLQLVSQRPALKLPGVLEYLLLVKSSYYNDKVQQTAGITLIYTLKAILRFYIEIWRLTSYTIIIHTICTIN